MPDPATPLWRAAQVFRLLSCVYALGFQIAVNRDLDRPAIGWLLFAVLIGWSVVCAIAYLQGFGRRLAWVLAEIAVVVALMLSTEVIASDQWVLGNQSWPTTLWATNATISAAIQLGPIAGMLTGLVVMGAAAALKGYVHIDLGRNATIVIELAVGLAVGMAAQTARASPHQTGRGRAAVGVAGGAGDGCPARCTTARSRCWPWCSGADAKSAVRQRNWPNSPVSRNARCGAW